MTQAQIMLSSLCGILMVAFIYQLSAPLPTPDPPLIKLHEKPLALSAPVGFVPPAPSRFTEIDDRPVFNPSRKPIARAPLPGAQPATPPPPTLSLIGIIADGKTDLALVRTPGSAFATSLSVGAAIGGWQVSEIKPDRIVLHAGTTDHEILLNENAVPESAPQHN